MANSEISRLFYITHIDNVPSILEKGILSHDSVEKQQIQRTPIYNSEIVSNRKEKFTSDNRSLWEYANLYFQARNPMLYRVIHEKGKNNIAVIGVSGKAIHSKDGVFITTGNAASNDTEILPLKEGLKKLPWKSIDNQWWSSNDGSKRKIMAESLIPNSISNSYIDTIYVPLPSIAEKLKSSTSDFNVEISPEPNMFFQPTLSKRVTENLFLVDGDMFFSNMQTLTVSVNIVGVMGKGLASRAKYQFPDVYVKYQDACRSKQIAMGKPYLYKREQTLDLELAEDGFSLQNPNAKKWFLLFPTKRHWRNKSQLEDIRNGLSWLEKNYKRLGISSIAMPALGCGLGQLKWEDVGPVMCSSLSKLDIQVSIYLPREAEIPKHQLVNSFLIKS